MKTKSAAILTIHDAPSMSKRGRTAIVKWLRRQADFLDKESVNLSHRFTARYLYGAMLIVAVFALAGCGKTVDQIVKTGQDLIGIAGETYKDVKDNVETAKKFVVPASPAEPTK